MHYRNAQLTIRHSTLRAPGGPLWMALFVCLAFSASAQTSSPAPIRNIVLVHGAFADGSSWHKVISILQRDGYHVTAVQNPLTSLTDDVAATQRVLARQQGDVILVGHSWAGAVVTAAGTAENVKGIETDRACCAPGAALSRITGGSILPVSTYRLWQSHSPQRSTETMLTPT